MTSTLPLKDALKVNKTNKPIQQRCVYSIKWIVQYKVAMDCQQNDKLRAIEVLPHISESGNFLLVESGIQQIFAEESGYTVQGIRYPTSGWNPESKIH